MLWSITVSLISHSHWNLLSIKTHHPKTVVLISVGSRNIFRNSWRKIFSNITRQWLEKFPSAIQTPLTKNTPYFHLKNFLSSSTRCYFGFIQKIPFGVQCIFFSVKKIFFSLGDFFSLEGFLHEYRAGVRTAVAALKGTEQQPHEIGQASPTVRVFLLLQLKIV